ncbi:MAG: AAA family ATPase [Spirochaetota bacterium]
MMLLTQLDIDSLPCIHKGSHSLIYLKDKSGYGMPVIIKVPANDVAAESFLNEYTLTKKLSVPGIRSAIEQIVVSGKPALVLAYIEGGTIKKAFVEKRRSMAEILSVSISIAQALHNIHSRKIIHRNISSTNIIADSIHNSATIIDFRISSQGDTITDYLNFEFSEDSLSYISPEQTGRINRSVDSRSDLYSFGIVLYEMLTGVLPFQAEDALELVYCHIASPPKRPEEIAPALPPAISEITLKLLSKAAEDRYQTALGLKFDLEKCLTLLKKGQEAETFILGEKDIPDRLMITEKIYGRESEIQMLMNIFERIVNEGFCELAMVAGYSGIGKTSLVQELYKPVTRERGTFVRGKFDQYKLNIPYSAIVEALQELIHKILTGTELQISEWSQRIRNAVGTLGQLIIDVIPQIELIIGKQLPIRELSPSETSTRFNVVFLRFIDSLAQKDHPLVIFLDDLQWADSASLTFLEHILTNQEKRYLFIIGSYRDNEVTQSHPLTRTLEKIQKAGLKLHSIKLSPLSPVDVSYLIADSLHTQRSLAEPLAGLIYKKTAGNPFFIIQFLKSLYEDKLIAFDTEQQCWTWNIDRIKTAGYTDNVIDLMSSKLKKLSVQTQNILCFAACIGNTFDLLTLALINEMQDKNTRQAIEETLKEGLLLHVRINVYKFMHDRVQQAAYSLIPQEQLAGLHLRIGRLLLAKTRQEDISEFVFEIVNQLNPGSQLITNESEKVYLAELNLLAGRRAAAATAYLSAIGYFSAGQLLLSADSWKTSYELTFNLGLERARCEWLCSNYIDAAAMLEVLMEHASSRADRLKVYQIKILLHTTLDENEQAVMTILSTMSELFGIIIPLHPSLKDIRDAAETIWKEMGERSIKDLLSLPVTEDQDIKAANAFLSASLPTTFFFDANLTSLLSCQIVILSIRYGNSEYSPHGYAFFGTVIGQLFDKWDEAYRFGRLAMDMAEMKEFSQGKAVACHVAATFINIWVRHAREVIPVFRAAFQAATQSGEMNHACYTAEHITDTLLMMGVPLPAVAAETAGLLEFVRYVKYEAIYDIINSIYNVIQELRGESLQTRTDKELITNIPDVPVNPWGATIHYTHQLLLRLILGDYNGAFAVLSKVNELIHRNTTGAVPALPKACDIIAAGGGQITAADITFYTALTISLQYDPAVQDDHINYMGELEAYRGQYAIWKKYCPENFANRYALLSAELARLRGSDMEAMRLYDEAIDSARDNGFTQNQALSAEIASNFYRNRGFVRTADAYLNEARKCYSRWGANAKVKKIDDNYPMLFKNEPESSGTDQLDILSVVKSSQAISGEIVPEKLIKTLMKIVIENAGAERGILILDIYGSLFVKAEASGQDTVIHSIPVEARPDLPHTVINYVYRSGDTVVLDDAAISSEYTSDPYINNKKIKSLLCMPIIKQNSIIGIIYLENNLAAGIFRPQQLKILEIICAQAAISLDNSRLYQEINQEIAERKIIEMEIQKFNDELEERVAERTGQLEAANKELEAFSYSVSHDLRAPLRAIDGYTRILVEDYEKSLDDDGRRVCSVICAESRRMGKLIDDLLAFSRLGRASMNSVLIDMENLVKMVFTESVKPEERNKIDLRIGTLPKASGDPALIGQVWINLISNAVKFSGRNEQRVIEISGRSLTEEYEYTIRDNGAGFDMEHAENLFGVFQRLHSIKEFEGTGVGLAIVKRIITRHGGRVWAESKENSGAAFSFTLPKKGEIQ